jgi:hypothetical protein
VARQVHSITGHNSTTGETPWSPRLAPYVLTTLYPECGEAVVCQVFPRPEVDLDAPPPAADEVDPVACWERANRRARSRSRRYIVRNRLRFMWVLTFNGEGLHTAAGRAEAMRLVARFARQLRARWGVQPYWYSPELHPGGHGWHVNLFLRRRLPHAEMAQLWGHGFVWAKDWTRDNRVKGATFLERLRAGATYGAKYASKDWDAEMLDGGAHRYERAEGYEPVAVLAEVGSVGAGVRLALAHLAGPAHVWWSSDADDWVGPECAVVMMGRARAPS